MEIYCPICQQMIEGGSVDLTSHMLEDYRKQQPKEAASILDTVIECSNTCESPRTIIEKMIGHKLTKKDHLNFVIRFYLSGYIIYNYDSEEAMLYDGKEPDYELPLYIDELFDAMVYEARRPSNGGDNPSRLLKIAYKVHQIGDYLFTLHLRGSDIRISN